jgi:hypothetical protein
MSRGRPTEEKEVLLKYTQVMYEVPSKPEIGGMSKWYYDKNKVPNGPYKTEYSTPKGYKHPKIKPEKGKAYSQQPVVLVYKTSNRSNAQTKIKVFNNENIDYILSTEKLIGIPLKAEIIEMGVGKSMINRYKQKYKLN